MMLSNLLIVLCMMPMVSGLRGGRALSSVKSSAKQELRHLQDSAVTTSTCDKIRTNRFPARLELEYFYLVETVKYLPDLNGIAGAISRAVLDSLHNCDDGGYPTIALDKATSHAVADEAYCIPMDPENECIVIRGRTDIYLDDGAASVRDNAYDAIEVALENVAFVTLYEPLVVNSRFLRSIQENLVMTDPASNLMNVPPKTSSSIVVAVAVASCMFVIASVFLYGVLRRQTKLNNSRRLEAEQAAGVSRKKTHRRNRKYFSPLDDDGSSHDAGTIIRMGDVANNNNYEGRCWSVSDITSDSGSVASIISRTTSRLEKIEEEDGDSDLREEVRSGVQKEMTKNTEEYEEAYTAHKSRLGLLLQEADLAPESEDGQVFHLDSPSDLGLAPTSDTEMSLGIDTSEDDDSKSPPRKQDTIAQVRGKSSATRGKKQTRSRMTVVGFNDVSALTADDDTYDGMVRTIFQENNMIAGDTESVVSQDSLQRWLAQLLRDLEKSQKVRRIEL